MDARQISDDDLLDLAGQVRCLTGQDDCRCGGCCARARLKNAAEHVARGDLLDAHFELTAAQTRYTWAPLDEAAVAVWLAMRAVPEVA